MGRSNQVVIEVLKRPDKFSNLCSGLSSLDFLVRMRAADAIEKITRKNSALLHPYKKRLLELAGRADGKEVRWHLAQLLPRLDLSTGKRNVARDILFDYLRDSSSIVKTFAMQAIAELTQKDKALAAGVLPMIRQLTEIGTPAMRARGRKIVRKWTMRASS